MCIAGVNLLHIEENHNNKTYTKFKKLNEALSPR